MERFIKWLVIIGSIRSVLHAYRYKIKNCHSTGLANIIANYSMTVAVSCQIIIVTNSGCMPL